MEISSWVGLVNNAALLLALGLLYDLLPLRERGDRPGWPQALTGLTLGAVGVAVMLNPVRLLPGVVFDTRSVLLALAGLFFGTVPTIIAGAIVAIFRLLQGGSGAAAGAAVALTCGAVGLAWRHLRRSDLERISAGELYLLGLAIQASMLLWMLALPGGIGPGVLRAVGPATLIIYPIATLLLGLVLKGREARKHASATIRASEERYRQLAENLRQVVWLRDHGSNHMLYVNPAYETVWGRPCAELYRDPQAFAACIVPEDRERVLRLSDELFDQEYRIVRPDGQMRWIRARTYPVASEDGAATREAGIAEDITERKAAEAALRESEARYRDLYQHAARGIFHSTPDGKFLDMNPALAQMLGYDSPAEAVAAITDIAAQVYAEPPRREQVVASILAQDDVAIYDNVYRRKNGELWYAHLHVRTVRDAQGQPVCLEGFVEDVTERRQAEAALRDSERALRRETEIAQRYLDVAPAIIMAMDAQGKITLLNQHGGRVLECDPQWAIGRDWFSTFLPAEAQGPVRQVFDGIMAGQMEGVEFYENAVRTARGRERLLQWHNTLLRDDAGRIIGTLTAGDDVTERKQAERELAASEERYRRLVEAANEGIWALDADFRVAFVNQQMADLLGYRPEEILGRLSTDFMPPAEQEDARLRLTERLAGVASHYERRLARRDGAIITTLASGAPLLDEGGRVVGAVTLFADITERKAAEAALAASEERFASFMRYLPGAVSIKDRDGRLVFCNEPFAAAINQTPEALLGRTVRDYTPPEAVEQFEAENAQALAENRAIEFEQTFAGPRGLSRWLTIKFPIARPGQPSLLGAISLDVTARRQAEESLRQRERDLNAAQQLAQVGSWRYDPATQQVAWSDEMYRIFGVDPARGAPSLAEHRKLIHRDDWERFSLASYRAMTQGEGYQIEFRVARPDGSIRHVLSICEPQRDAAGRVTELAGVAQDITERKLTEQALSLQGLVLDQISDAVTVTDLEGVITYVNDAECRLLGRSRAELIGSSVRGYGEDPARGGAQEEIIAATRARGEWRGEVVNTAADGREVLLDVRVHLVRDEAGRPVALCGISTDITARAQAQAALRDSEERFRSIYETSPVGIAIVTTADQCIVQANPAMQSLLGYTEDELRLLTVQDITHPDDMLAERADIEAVLDGQAPGYSRDKRYIRKDGSEVWVNLTGAAFGGEGGRPQYGVALVQDVTARKQMEEALRESEQHYKLAIEGASLGAWDWDIPSGAVAFNERWAEMLGYDLSEIQPHVRAWERLLHPDDAPRVYEALNAHLRGETPEYVNEHRLRHKDGHWVWVLDRGRVIERDAEGRPLRACGTHLDITPGKELEQATRAQGEALRESEERYQAFINATEDIAFLKDDQLRYVIVNEANARFLGRSVAEIVGRADDELMPPDAARACRQSDLQTLRAGRMVRNTERVGDRVYETIKFPVTLSGGRVGVGGYARDVTELERAQAALRTSEARRRQAQRLARVGYWDWFADGDRVSWSDEVYEMFGLDPATPPTMRLFDKAVHPDDRERFAAERRRVKREGGDISIEYRIVRPDGAVRHAHEWAEVERDDSGDLVSVHGTMQDITERKLAEQAVRESEERYRLLLHNANDAVYVHQLSPEAPGRFLEVNDQACRMLGYTREEFLALEVPAIDVPEQPERLLAIMPALWATGRAVFETEHVAKDGRRIPVEVSTRLFEIGGEQVVLSVARDITERKRAEQVLRESEGRFRSLVETAPDAIFVQTNHRFAYANAVALALFGARSLDELLGQPVIERFHPDYREVVAARIERLNVERQSVPLNEEVILRLDGSPVTTEIVATPTTYEGLNGALVFVRDVTARKQAEAERARLEEQLREARRLESIGLLAGGVAHDLNNTLTPVLGYGQLLRDDLPADDPHQLEVGEIVACAERARDLVRQLLAFARKQNLIMKPLDLNQVVGNLTNMLRRTLREDIAIETHLAPDIGLVSGDRGQIEQIILNLAVNAQDAMPQGGAVVIETSAATLDAEYAVAHEGVTPGRYALLTVSDTGAGMDQHTLDHLFEPFFTTKPVGKGVGLGLATVYGIIKQHGGHIHVYSEPGRGSTFRVYLPRLADPAPAKQAATDLAPPARGAETILLVEDQDQVRALARQLLRRQGYTVLEARHGQAALAVAQAHPGAIHLLVADVVMPEMSGPELRARLEATRPGLRTLYMSGYADAVIAPHGVLEEGVLLIQKPFSLPDFVAAVRAALDRE